MTFQSAHASFAIILIQRSLIECLGLCFVRHKLTVATCTRLASLANAKGMYHAGSSVLALLIPSEDCRELQRQLLSSRSLFNVYIRTAMVIDHERQSDIW